MSAPRKSLAVEFYCFAAGTNLIAGLDDLQAQRWPWAWWFLCMTGYLLCRARVEKQEAAS